MKNKIVFIGGSLDGQVKEWDGKPFYSNNIPPKFPGYRIGENALKDVNFVIEEYLVKEIKVPEQLTCSPAFPLHLKCLCLKGKYDKLDSARAIMIHLASWLTREKMPPLNILTKRDVIASFKDIQSGEGIKDRSDFPDEFKGNVAKARWNKNDFEFGMEYGILFILWKLFDIKKEDL